MYPDSTSRSAQLFERARKVLPGGNTRLTVFHSPYPNYAVRGEGCYVTDADGQTRLDCANNYASLVHGHRHPKVMEAIRKQMDRIMAVTMPTEAEIALAEELCRRLPGVDAIRFANSGSEGVMFALRVARAYTGRSKVAKAEGAYHGSYDSMDISLDPEPPEWGPDEEPRSVPHGEGIAAPVARETVVVPFNDTDGTERILEKHASELAAVIVDVLPARLGFRPAEPEYLRMLREVTRRHGIVLIFDEVITFRLGYHGAQGYVGITPDLTTMGKLIGGGFPVGAVGGKREIMDCFDHTGGRPRVFHSGTFNANPMTMAAGLATLELLSEESFQGLESLGDKLRGGMREALRVAGVPGIVQGRGSLAFLLLGDSKEIRNYRDLATAETNREWTARFHHFLLNNGIFTAGAQHWILSTPMTEAEIDFILERVLGACAS